MTSTEPPTPYLPSFSHSDSCDRYYADDEDTETACTCGADQAQAWLDALVAERDRLLSLGSLLADEDRALELITRAVVAAYQSGALSPSSVAPAVLAALREVAGL